MKPIPLFALLYSALLLMLGLACLTLRDPMVRRCQALQLKMAFIQDASGASDCRAMLARAEKKIREANELKAKMRQMTEGPAPSLSWEEGLEYHQFFERRRHLRAQADSLLVRVEFLMRQSGV